MLIRFAAPRSYFEMPDEQDEDAFRQQSPWLLRIELNREMMVDKKLSMADVGHRITQEFGDDVAVIFSDDNADKLILRIRLMQVRTGVGGVVEAGGWTVACFCGLFSAWLVGHKKQEGWRSSCKAGERRLFRKKLGELHLKIHVLLAYL
jgi:hypothetical protein